MNISRILASVSALALITGAAHAGTFEKTATGVIVHPDSGTIKELRLEVMNDSIIHVLGVDDATREQIPSLMTVATPQPGDYAVTQDKGFVTLKAPKASAKVDLKTGLVTFYNDKGVPVLSEANAAITPVTVEGKPYVATRAEFNPGTTEAFYGLGQHQNAQMNLNGEDLLLSQHNMDVAIPFVVSDKNYGLLWDNDSITRWGNPRPYSLMGQDLKLTAQDGSTGLTAKYYIDDKLVLTRVESDIKYQYLKDVAQNWPAEITPDMRKGKTVKGRLGWYPDGQRNRRAQDAALCLRLWRPDDRRQEDHECVAPGLESLVPQFRTELHRRQAGQLPSGMEAIGRHGRRHP